MGATADTNLNGTDANRAIRCTRQEVPNTDGNWLTVTLDSDRKFMIENTGYDSSGNSVTTRIKVVYNVTTEPDTGGAASTFSAETNTEWLNAKDVIYPPRNTTSLSMKAETGTKPMVFVRVIERMVAGHES